MNSLSASAIWFTVILLSTCSADAADPWSVPRNRITNYDECVLAGYPTGKLAGRERCWIPRLTEEFFKGVKSTIKQGAYGTLVLRTGNCMPGSNSGVFGDPCRYEFVNRRLYVFLYTPNSPILRASGELTENVLNTYPLIASTEMRNTFYEVELPPGQFLIFAEDQSTLWGAGFVTVEQDYPKEKHLMINWAAD